MDKRRRKKAKGDDENDEKTLVFIDVSDIMEIEVFKSIQIHWFL